jgi:hypothetical protein
MESSFTGISASLETAVPDMRFAPPKQLRIADRSDGLNPERVRSFNERLVLSLLLQNGGISRLEIGERTKLSAQTVSVIVRSLEHEGLLSMGEAMRGRVGPPTIPVLLNPHGAYSVGVDLASWENEVVLIDFMGTIRFHTKLARGAGDQAHGVSAIRDAVGKALAAVPEHARQRVAGIGLAFPADEKTGQGEQSAPSKEEVDLHNDLEQHFKLPVFVQNDVTAAASAEMMFGSTKSSSDHLYWFLGAMLHSRLVLNNHVYTGNYSVAPASLDLGLLALQRRAEKEMEQPVDLHLEANWSRLGESLTRWRSECVVALKGSIRSLAQFVDIRTVVISAAVPQTVSDAICVDLQRALPGLQVIGGAVRQAPKAVGAGSLPFISRFTVQM